MEALRCAWIVWTRFEEHDGWAIASHMALATLMAIFPFLIFVVALGGVVGPPQLQNLVVNLLFESWPHAVAEPIAEEVKKVLGNARPGLLTIGAILAVILASNGVEAVRVGVNRAYGVRESRPFWFTRLQSLLFIMIAAIALITLAVLVVLWPVLWSRTVSLVPAVERLAPAISLARYAITLLVLVSAIVSIHFYLAAGPRKLRQILPGVGLTLALWLTGGYLFGYYLEDFATYSRTYAGLAGVVAALFFLWLVAVAFLFGAELNAFLIAAARSRRQAQAPAAGP